MGREEEEIHHGGHRGHGEEVFSEEAEEEV
jgi:hypothetical protein